MVDQQRALTLVYNGEIYDHDRLRSELSLKGYSFRTRSDTEVILALYAIEGLDFLEKLRGEFSFALVDENRREIILVRDRMGIKPLFYARVGQRFLFASEIKAIFRYQDVPRAIDPMGLLGAMSVSDIPGATVFEGIKQVRHATMLRVSLDDLSMVEHRYWDAYERRHADLPRDPRELMVETKRVIESAIELRLRADVPLGAYLSGGIDSSLVTASMARKVDRLDAFGLAFEDSPRHNEYGYAEMVAREYPNIRLHRIPVTYNDTIRRLPEAVWHLERPIGNLHSVAKIMCAQYARDYVVAVLTGDGGDESFCGYATHWLQNELQAVRYSLPAIRARLKAMRREAHKIGGNRYYLAGGLARRIGPETKFLEDRLGFRPCDLATGVDTELRLRILLAPEFLDRLTRSPTEALAEQLARGFPAVDGRPHAELLQYVQLNTSVPEYIATIADRSETAGSVEARLPLFDHKVVEWAMGLPIEMKLKGDREKHILREIYRDWLPEGVIERRKQAFLAPPAPFSCPEGRMILERYLNPSAIRSAGIWSPGKIKALLFARKAFPRNKLINLALTVVSTSQILHQQFIEGKV